MLAWGLSAQHEVFYVFVEWVSEFRPLAPGLGLRKLGQEENNKLNQRSLVTYLRSLS